jgi:hypothetical protein
MTRYASSLATLAYSIDVGAKSMVLRTLPNMLPGRQEVVRTGQLTHSMSGASVPAKNPLLQLLHALVCTNPAQRASREHRTRRRHKDVR